MKSDQSGKHMSLQSFKKYLELMVANVVSMVAKAKEATGASVSFVRKSIMRCIRSSLPREDLYVIDVPLINFSRGLGPSFGKLPRELRDQILSDLIASGHPQFMSASRVMNTEGMALIFRKGIFRIRFDFDAFKKELTSGKCPLPTANIVDKIQNLGIRIRSRDTPSSLAIQRYAKRFSCLGMFKKDSPFTHRNCTVVFDVPPYRASVLLLATARSLEGFKNFETVVMRMDFDLDAIPWVPKHIRRELIVSTRDSCFAVMQARFKPHLGKGGMWSDSDGLRVIFHPRKAQRKNAVGEM